MDVKKAGLDLPSFARGTVSGSAGGHYRLAGVNVPVVCGGIEVSPGDFIAGDEDGVAVAPRARCQEVIRKAIELRREKKSLMPLIRRYRSYTKALQANSKVVRR
jgi:4-hydroxy-4-methyl-2-oxoglutarate aldolase